MNENMAILHREEVISQRTLINEHSMKYISLIGFMIFFSACSQEAGLHQTSVELFKGPAHEGTSLPFLKVGEDHQLYLSWVGETEDRSTLYFASLEKENKWSDTEVIASGTNWFVNWADYPSLNIDSQGNKISHFLAKSSSGTYSYDVNLTMSMDSQAWSSSIIPHDDQTPTEHGFASILPMPNQTFTAVWLDGRNTGTKSDDKHGQGAMTLRTANINLQGVITEPTELDARVCDCCQTSGALTSAGPVFVYRDRTEEEYRDISIVRKVKGQWTAPKTVFNDQWKIAGCPVNGPRIVAQEDQVAVAWFSAPNDVPQVKIIFSKDAGATFEAPIVIDNRNPLGRVDVAMDEKGTAFVSWLSFQDEKSQIKAIAVNSTGIIGNPIVISETNSSRSSGFPQMELLENQLHFAWTTSEDDRHHIKHAKVSL